MLYVKVLNPYWAFSGIVLSHTHYAIGQGNEVKMTHSINRLREVLHTFFLALRTQF